MKKIFVLMLICAIMTMATGCKGKTDITNKNPSSDTVSEQFSSEPEESSSNISAPSISEPTSEDLTSSEIVPVQGVMIDGVLYDEEKLSSFEQYENETKGWGQGVRFDKLNRPETCDPAQQQYGESGGIFIMPVDEAKMYLTFDEGYENGYTGKILDALKEKEVPAVFFVTMPYVKSNPDLIKRMIDEGHVIGNHSVNHKIMPELTSAEVVEEISGLHNYMVENYNYQMTLFRPPEGKYSTRTMEIAKELGYKTVLWSFAYLDYDVNKQMGIEKALPKIVDRAHNGAVYLLHAVSKDNAEMMGDFIDAVKAKGFEFALL